ncbi:uncharacterized protein TNCV_304461 [Trichonephila clavipes]|nr:uncharacterized protein TNCV_304461 [Trichonephila clavipes]
MRVREQWTDKHRATRKAGSGQRKFTSARDERHLLRIEVNDRPAYSRQLAARWSTAMGILMSTSSICECLLHRKLHARLHLCRIPSRQTIDGCVCNRLMSTEPG